MPNFISELLTIISVLILGGAPIGGQPINTPPNLSEIEGIGIEVSAIAKDFHNSPTPTPSFAIQTFDNQEENNYAMPEKIPAYNYSSDKEMPSTLPTNAIDNSPSLGYNPPSEPTPTPTCIPRPACLDSEPRCLMPETESMCPPPTDLTPTPIIEPIEPPYPIDPPWEPCPTPGGKFQDYICLYPPVIAY